MPCNEHATIVPNGGNRGEAEAVHDLANGVDVEGEAEWCVAVETALTGTTRSMR